MGWMPPWRLGKCLGLNLNVTFSWRLSGVGNVGNFQTIKRAVERMTELDAWAKV